MAEKYYIKKDPNIKTQWMWIIGKQHTWLIGWDYHLKGVEIYNYQKFSGTINPEKKGIKKANSKIVNIVLQKLLEDIVGVTNRKGIAAGVGKKRGRAAAVF